MREFRVWDNNKKVMWTANDDEILLTIHLDGTVCKLNEQTDLWDEFDGTLMYSAGFSDSHGTRIFEGDVVKRLTNIGFENWEVRNFVVYYGVWCWMKALDIEKQHAVSFDAVDARSNCAVIGNIHANPELLEIGKELKEKIK